MFDPYIQITKLYFGKKISRDIPKKTYIHKDTEYVEIFQVGSDFCLGSNGWYDSIFSYFKPLMVIFCVGLDPIICMCCSAGSIITK